MRGVPLFRLCASLFLCFSEGRKGGRAPPCESVFEAEKIQHVDSLLACKWRGDVERPWHPLRRHGRTSTGNALLSVRSHVDCPCINGATR